MTWALSAGLLPVGSSAPSAAELAAGRFGPSDRRIGARMGALMNTAAATPARQSPESTRVTAGGRVVAEVPEYTAWATPAASAVGSAPPTRVVFLVAKPGNPSSRAAEPSCPRLPRTGPRLW